MRMFLRSLALATATVLCLFLTVPAFAHNLPMGGSRWCFGKNAIVANLDLSPSLLAEIKEIKEGHYDFDSISDEQLQHIVAGILQPYISKRLSIAIDDKPYPVKVGKAVRNGNIYTIWLSVDNVSLHSESRVRIDYTLLLEETNNVHVNLAYGYFSDATGDALQRVFDFSPPALQTTFDAAAHAWEVTLPVAVTSGGPDVVKSGRDAISTRKSMVVAPQTENNDNTAAASQKQVMLVQRARNERSQDDHNGVRAPLPNESDGSASHTPANESIWTNITRFIWLGIEHILTGYDHIAFLLALIVIGLSVGEVLKIITAFTVAHSITLLLAALQIVSLNSRIVESVIAISICYVALENLFRKKVNYRWMVTFGFGLVHGFGFASALQELIVGRSNLLVSVVSFNMGVEIGQVMIFLVMLPILFLLKNKIEFRRVTIGTSLAIFLLGFAWFIERGFNLKFLPI